jgi:tetratricopeptide (TPR) repeat protein
LFALLDEQDRRSAQAAYAHSVVGRARLALGHYDDARRCLCSSRDLFACLPAADELQRLDVLLALAELTQRLGDFTCSEQYLGEAESILDQAEQKFGGYVAERRIHFCQTAARRWLAMGQLEPAQGCFSAALAKAEQNCACHYLIIVPSWLGLARIASEQNLTATALEHVHCALQLLQTSGASMTPEMAWTLHELAFAYVQDNKSDQAQTASENAIRVLGMSLRAGHPDEAAMRLCLASSLLSKHLPERALDEISRAVATLRQFMPCRVFDAARAMRFEAEVHHARRAFDCARFLLECARRLWCEHESRVGVVHPERCLFSLQLAALAARRGDAAEIDAALKFDPFLKLAGKYKGAHERVAYEINRRANLVFEHGLLDEARWLYELAVEHYALACGPDHPFTTKARRHAELATKRLTEPGSPELCPCAPCYRPCSLDKIAPCECLPVCCL